MKTKQIPAMAAPDTFCQCQLCGHASKDICEFRMWQRCDEQDKLTQNYLVTCQSDSCLQTIDDDPILFREVPWSQGGPGRFMLLCGNCPQRENFSCNHPNLKSNGGEGLLVKFSQTPLSGARICMADGSSVQLGPPATRCEGHPDPIRQPTQTVKQQ